MEDNFIDEFDISSLIGMSSLINREETDNQVNAKEVEKELISKLISDDVEFNSDNESVTNDPISEYNSIVKTHLENINVPQCTQPPVNLPVSNFTSDDKYNIESYGQVDTPSFELSTKSINDELDTEEHANQRLVDGIFKYQNSVPDSNYDLLDENISDTKMLLLEKISSLREELENNGVNLDKISDVNESSSLDEVEYIAKLLMLKVNRDRYSTFGEECILAMARGLETMCDGKRKIFGFQPDLTNCTDIVKVKLRRVKNETSQIVSNVVDRYGISPLMTVLLELIPSLYLHSRRRKIQSSSQWNLYDDINEIRKF